MMDTYQLLKRAKIRLGQYHMDGNKLVLDSVEENPKIEELLLSARQSVIEARNYPSTWESEQIEKDLEKFESVMISLVVYDYNKEGMDYETTHTESGVTRQFASRNRILGDVIPFVHIL